MTDDELIDLAGHLSSGISFDGSFNTPPITGSVWDQAPAAGIQNPYWEIVRRMPTGH